MTADHVGLLCCVGRRTVSKAVRQPLSHTGCSEQKGHFLQSKTVKMAMYSTPIYGKHITCSDTNTKKSTVVDDR